MPNASDMHGKVCLITGATDGIGRVAAEKLAQAGTTLNIVGRSPEKTARVAEEIRAATGNQQVDFFIADLSVQAEVRKLADAFRQRHQRLDVLINNAGAIYMTRQVSRDGLEMTFALNHLGYFLLTNLLLDRLTASAPARVINVSSGAHLAGKIDFADLQAERSYAGFRAYSQSKLANVLFTYELARRIQGTGVTVNALHPGFVATNFGRSNGGFFDLLFRLVQRFGALTPEKGAETTVHLAASPEVEGVTGKYFVNSKPVSSSAASYDETTARHLWEVSEELTGQSVQM